MKDELRSLSQATKSIYFSIAKNGFQCLCQTANNQHCQHFLTEPWFYQNGVFNSCLSKSDEGKLVEIGRGGQGIVLEGKWCNKPAAFKFVRIRQEKEAKIHTHDVIAEMNNQINEMKVMNKIQGNSFVKIYGHFR